MSAWMHERPHCAGTCYITPLLGAWLADSHWGRYKTILVFSTIYLLVSAFSSLQQQLCTKCIIKEAKRSDMYKPKAKC